MKFLKATGTLLLSSIFIITSCKRDEPAPPSGTPGRTFTPGVGFFILNEGGFNSGNSSMSYYALSGTEAGSSFNNLFANVNGFPLGDVAQSMTMIEGLLYVVINNSAKIVVVNPVNLKVVRTITGLSGPRAITQVNSTTAYISQMYSDQVLIYEITTSSITGSISIGVTSEALALVNNKVYVTSQESDKLYIVDPSQSNTVDSSTTIAPGGNSMIVDSNGKLWILAYGNYVTSAPGGLFRVDPSTNAVEASMAFTTFDFPTHLASNPAGDSLYFLNYNVYRMAITDAGLPTGGFISGVGHAFYTIGLMPNSSTLFVGDAVDYVQAGLIFRYNGAGVQLDVDAVGVNPNGFLLY